VPDPAVCVFDLDHTLVDSPLDLRAVGREMEAFVRARRIALPERELRWSGAELLAVVRREASHLGVRDHGDPRRP
jgi:phosphoglycolate phosphatase-like HAD superfamily hydrolase